jgi:ubiquitin carboxyl-terminal hydrolase L3
MYRKHFVPLESDPEIFSELMHTLGVDKTLEFAEIYALDDDSLLQIARPVLAIILVFPDKGVAKVPETGFGKDFRKQGQNVVWVKQTINNACGLYAILHAVCNGVARACIGQYHALSYHAALTCPQGPNQFWRR